MNDIATVTMSIPAVVGVVMTIAASAIGVAGWIVSKIEMVRDELRTNAEKTRGEIQLVDRRVFRLELMIKDNVFADVPK